MTRFFATMVFALAAIGMPAVASAQYGYGSGSYDTRIVRCASDYNRSRTCHIDSRGGVRLVRQESRAACIKGRSWNYNAGGIWVGHGCAASFEVRTPRVAYQPRRDSRYGNDYYRSGYGSSYGNRDYDRTSNPIAAVLSVLIGSTLGGNDYRSGYGSGSRYGSGYGRQAQVFRCESYDGRQRFCRLPFHAQRIELRRQLSRTRCSEGYNWGARSDGVWVDRGCAAEFIVY